MVTGESGCADCARASSSGGGRFAWFVKDGKRHRHLPTADQPHAELELTADEAKIAEMLGLTREDMISAKVAASLSTLPPDNANIAQQLGVQPEAMTGVSE